MRALFLGAAASILLAFVPSATAEMGECSFGLSLLSDIAGVDAGVGREMPIQSGPQGGPPNACEGSNDCGHVYLGVDAGPLTHFTCSGGE